MNQSSLYGLIGGFVLICLMVLMSPESIGTFFNITGLLVVIGGTIAATLVSRPLKDIKSLLQGIPELLKDDHCTLKQDIDQLLQFAKLYRSSSLRTAEAAIQQMQDPFVKGGLKQIVDRIPRAELIKSLQWQITSWRNRQQEQVHILNSMALFAPAFGMLGTLFGLVHMLTGLGASGLETIGAMMAFAMMTTVYGIIAANLVLKPLAIKLERRTQQQLARFNALLEGILDIHARRHPELMEEKFDNLLLTREQDKPEPTYMALVRG